MTVAEKRKAISGYCKKELRGCKFCKLADVKTCYASHATDEEIEHNYNLIFGPEAADERGANNMDKETIIIDLERYDELIKKEAIYDKLTAGSDVNICVVPRLKEEKTNA